MELNKLVILSTAHLHPLEAKVINSYAYVANTESALFSTNIELRDFYRDGGLVCLVELLEQLKDIADYVLFDPDADVWNVYKSYDW